MRDHRTDHSGIYPPVKMVYYCPASGRTRPSNILTVVENQPEDVVEPGPKSSDFFRLIFTLSPFMIPQERPIQLLTITDLTPVASSSSPSISTSSAAKKHRKKIVFIMGRSHASEAPSSFIMQGLIDFLVSSHEVAQDLRKHLIFKLVPMMNPDGVFLGNTMGNLLGQDLNRHWHEPNRFLHPGIHAVRQLIHSYDREHDLDMILDVHSHISLLGLFVVGNSYDDVYR